ncbi:hypothetical protein BDV36DRAFT_259301 [Aspergillus pseudocaelatus]|uniref:Uncharacterized protein n=1 Tax=Aspergillus pseudocaelatus TaxID=1825620 RepID=A0ABQ6WHR1_9EURO|nr:hypothetical protein BDV36DRAFT_259301 [Aspergillus pseudocaelatus]
MKHFYRFGYLTVHTATSFFNLPYCIGLRLLSLHRTSRANWTAGVLCQLRAR